MKQIKKTLEKEIKIEYLVTIQNNKTENKDNMKYNKIPQNIKKSI